MTEPERPLPRGYEFVRELGAGGCGVVYLARQTSLDRLVALKRIHGFALVQGEALDRFRREAQVLATIDHRAVVRVFDFRRSEHDATLVMEYVGGESLAGRLERGQLPVAEALVVLRDVADALRAAAERGITHRDIKPGNVFLMPDGHAKLGDFGLARIVSDPSVFRTSTGEVSGTPAYFPPECGSPDHEADQRSDAYSFGVMAYEVLTGQLPFTGTDVMQIIAAHYATPPPSPAELVPGFPPAASAALLTALAKDPAARLLPRELVHRLAAVPAGAWPALATPPPQKVASSDPTVRGGVPPLGASPPAAAAPRPRRRRLGPRLLIVGGAFAAVCVLAVAALLGSAGGSSPLVVSSVTVEVTPADGLGRCPEAHYQFTAEVRTNGSAGEVRLRWTRPDGRTADVVRPVGEGQLTTTAVLRFEVTGDRPLQGQAAVEVLGPDRVEARSRPVTYSC